MNKILFLFTLFLSFSNYSTLSIARQSTGPFNGETDPSRIGVHNSRNISSGGQSYYVALTGLDTNPGTEALPWRTIQKAFDVATPGSTAYVKTGVYNEKLTLNVSGTASDGYITFQTYAGDSVIIDGTGISGDQIILIQNKKYIKLIGFELRNNLEQSFGTGIWVQGYGDHIEIRKNRIHDMKAKIGGGDAMGISIYGNDATIPISNIIIDSNQIYYCQPGHSESLTLNGNVDSFQVTNNIVHDNDNIGIDMIGGEGTCPTSSLDVARNGICRGNVVFNCRSNYGGGYAGGIYVDGGSNIIVERNTIYQCDIGLEIGCENHGKTASGMIVRDNLIFNNDKGGMGFGGYDYPTTGRVTNSQFLNNTCFANDTLKTGQGELYINFAFNCIVKNNIFYSNSQNRLLTTTVGNSSGNVLDYNLWLTPGGIANASADYNGTVYESYPAYLAGTGQDVHSIFADPEFVSINLPVPNLHLNESSPAVDAGDPSFIQALGETDFDGNDRVCGANVDIGAFEKYIGPPSTVPPQPVLVGISGTPQSPTVLWRIDSSATLYHLQVSSDQLFMASFFDDSTLTDTAYHIAVLPESTVLYWRVRAKNDVGFSDWSAVWSFYTGGGEHVYNIAGGWNMISLPLIVDDARKNELYPTAISDAFAYQGSYLSQDTFLCGTGYWLKFSGNQIIAMNGVPVVSDTIDVLEGWNMIGSITTPIAINSVTSLEPDIICSNFFGYNSIYYVTDSIRPGKGYWVKVNKPTQLIIAGSLTGHAQYTISIVPTADVPPSPPESKSIQIVDPVQFALISNYPNPFNPVTLITFKFPIADHVSLKIFNLTGRVVSILLDHHYYEPGEYVVSFDGRDLPSGIYFYRFQSEHYTVTKKMVLLR